MKKTLRFGSLLPVAALLAALLAGPACSGIRTSLAVRNFARGAGDKVAAHYAADPAKGDHLADRLHAALAVIPKDGALLDASYENDGRRFRFVVDRQTTPDHAALRELIAGALYPHGIDVASYKLEKINELEKAIADASQTLQSLRGTSLAEPESTALAAALKAAGAEDVTPGGILNFVAQPGNNGKFPNLQELAAKASAAAESRDEAIVALEAADALNLLLLMREMGVKDDQWPKEWTDSRGKIKAAFDGLIPVSPHYGALVKELARYRELAKQPAPPRLSGVVKRGDHGEHVAQLQKRLQMESYWGGPTNGAFDDALEQAVKLYQADRQVEADGKIEKVTLERLNVPIPDRVKQIKLALHKLRQSSTRGGDYFVRVNVGAQELEVYSDGGKKIERKHRIVVGNQLEKNHTPMFSATIEQIIFYPAWNVPQRIIKEEMARDFAKDPDFFKKHGYQVKFQYNKSDGAVEKILSVTQPPGSGNALGVVKIDFPNPYDVYLHDTNLKHLFARSVRTFSHGCMRVHRPIDLVKFLLEHDGNDAAPKVDEILQKHQSLVVPLKKKVPIHVEYVTVSTNEQGKAVFYIDPYKDDVDELAKLSAD